MIKLQKVLIF